uniref:Uncharacterized protein n=1 Tax=Caenorhabditis japonica TaxID=281687 RepID=A0A8R1I8Y4_CAEJA
MVWKSDSPGADENSERSAEKGDKPDFSDEELHGIPTICTPVPYEVIRHLQQKKGTKEEDDDEEEVDKMFFKVQLMEKKLCAFEFSIDSMLSEFLLKAMENIPKNINNKFSFYLYLSPYEVKWNRPRAELMRKPARSNHFRHLITPDQLYSTLREVLTETDMKGTSSLNVYIFIKQMDDVGFFVVLGVSACTQSNDKNRIWLSGKTIAQRIVKQTRGKQ